MATNQGNYDSSANVPLWAAASVFKAPTTAEATALYGNTTTSSYVTGEAIGVFAVDDNEIQVGGSKGSHAGWVLRTTGSGGRAGRVTEETLSVVSTFRTDNNADDAVYPDSSIVVSTQPLSALVRANTANANTASFTVAVASKPTRSTVTYVWQLNTADGVLGWTNVVDGVGTQRGNTTFAGSTSATLLVSPANTSANLLVFRVTSTSTPPAGITNATATSVTSANAQITVLVP